MRQTTDGNMRIGDDMDSKLETMTIHDHIMAIADYMQYIAETGYFAHPDPVARLHSVTMSVDAELFERMKKIRKEYEA